MNKSINGAGSLGAIVGIFYGVTKNKGFWGTAGFALLFAFGGVAIGKVYESVKND